MDGLDRPLDASLTDPNRLEALHRYDVLGLADESAFERVARLAALLLDTPIAGVHFLDDRCQWAAAHVGLDAHMMSLDVSFCAQELNKESLLIVDDATDDPRFKDNPLVTGEPGIRFYAGAAITTPDGYPLGRLCVMDTTARPEGLSEREGATLQELAGVIMDELEYRAQPRHREEILESITDAFLAVDDRWRITYFNQQAETILGRPRAELLGNNLWEEFPEVKELAFYDQYHRVMETGEPAHFEAYFPPLETWFEVKAYPMETGGLSVYYNDVTARRKREQALEESRHLLETSQRIAHLGHWSWDVEADTVEWSDEMYRIFGHDPGTLSPTLETYFNAIPEPERSHLQALMQQALDTRRSAPDARRVEHRIIRPDGTERVVELEAQVVETNVDGRPTRLLGTVLDITRQQQYKDALREEENLLARIFDTSAAAINVLDTHGRIVRANGRAKEVLGLTPSAMEGRLYDDPQWNIEAVDGGPFPHDELPFHRVMATEAPVYNVRHAITWPNGQRRVLSISGGPLHDEDGTVEGAVFIISDVTDQHEQDKAFRDQQRRLEMALSGGNVGMWDWDMKTGVVTYDERWAAMLGYDLSEVDDHQSFFESRTHPDDFDRLQAAAARHAEGQTPHIDEEIRVRHRDGTWRWGLDRAKIMEWDADGSPRRMVGTHLDITARKRAEQALRQQRDLLNQTQRLAGAWELDLDTDRVTFSEEIIRILEWPADKPARFGELGHLFTPSTREKLRNAVQAACEHGTPYDLELPLTTVGGNKRWIRTVAAPIERDGTIVKLAGAMQDITERKHHEEALRRERDLLQNIFDASPAAIVTTNADGDFTAASLKAQQVLDLTPSEVQARSFNDPQWRITDPEGDPIPDEELPFAQVKDTGAPLFEHEQTIEWPDGARRLLSVSGAPLTGANGQFDGAVFVIDDITERRRRESIEERFGRILQTVPSEIYIFDADTLQFVQTSKGAQVNLGYSADELATLTPVDLQPRDRSAFEALIAPLRAGSDDVVTVETTHRRNDGTTYPVELRLQYNHSEPQPVFIAIGMDISERVAHEAALRRGKRYAERLIESMQDGFSVIGAGGVQVQVNEAFCEMTGFREDELLGEMPPYPYWADGEHETIQATLHRAFEGDTGDVELIFQTKSGDRFPVLVSPTRLTDTVGEPVYYFATVKDISDRKKYENGLIDAKQAAEAAQLKAEEMNRLKDAFLANMSHEIRTPLTAILGLTDVLEGQLHGKQSELVMMVREAGQRLERTLTSVLDLAELESHSVQMQPDEIDLTREVRQALSLFSRQADEKGLRLVTDFPGQPVSVTLDVGAVQRILTNLISNAIKFTDGGFVRVGVHPGRTRVVIEVEDSGIGIEPDYVDKIFQEFTQESAGYTRAYEGVGLGLHITKRLVEVLGGQIALQSVKGEGTTFTVTLPYTMSGDAVSNGDAGRAPQPASPDEALMGSPNAAPSVSGAPDQPPPGEQLPAGVVHLLLVDDNALSRELFPLLMEEIAPQYVVDVAKTGEEALVRAAAAQYDGFVIDINLGEGMNGVDLMHELRAGTTYATTPMMACTAYALPDDEERLLSEGFNTYLSKPYRTSGLLAALQHMFAPDPGA